MITPNAYQGTLEAAIRYGLAKKHITHYTEDGVYIRVYDNINGGGEYMCVRLDEPLAQRTIETIRANIPRR